MLDPTSFELVAPGRAMYVVFLWLFLVEIVIAWNKPSKNKFSSLNIRIPLGFAAMLFPMAYVVLTFMLGFKSQIIDFGRFLGVPYQQYGLWFLETAWPISFEMLLFVCCFLLTVWLLYGLHGLKLFLISGFFLGAFSVFTLLGQVFFPAGSLGIAQAFVPVTVTVSAWFLNFMGYATHISPVQGGSVLRVDGNSGSAAFLVYWPSAGIQSLILYSFTILLFLRVAAMPFWRKGTYFLLGLIGTFFVNIFRIVSISTLAVNVGMGAARMFHDYYGELYFIMWMIAYLLIVFVIERYAKRLNQPGASGIDSK